jgi:hypothetical protein
MWECPKCRERHEGECQVCWNCGTSRNGVEDLTFVKANQNLEALPSDAEAIAAGEPERGSSRRASDYTVDQLVFVGLNGYALALDRDTGEIVWSNNEMHRGYVSLLLDGDRLLVSTNGYMYCLNPLTGRILWHNPLTGYGMAPTSLVSARGQRSASPIQQAGDEVARLSS